MMFTSSSPFTYSLPRLIETEGLHQRYHQLCELAFSLLDDSRALLRNAHAIARAARTLIKAEQHNERTLTKWEMLLTPRWRKRVLRDLGGTRGLKRWEKRFDRAALRRAGIPIIKPAASAAQLKARAANLAKAKAVLHAKTFNARRKFWDNTHPNVFLDRVKVDMEGLFRLAPIERGPRKKPRTVKTQLRVQPRRHRSGLWESKPKTVEPERRIKYTTLNPISLWPQDWEMVGVYECRSPSPTPSPSVIPCLTRDQPTHHEDSVEDRSISIPPTPNSDSPHIERLSAPHRAFGAVNCTRRGDKGKDKEAQKGELYEPD